jgi:predicted tellurium resistance membrane protein TerC
MRGILILLGAALIARFHWILYLFGVFLVFTGLKMLFSWMRAFSASSWLTRKRAKRAM